MTPDPRSDVVLNAIIARWLGWRPNGLGGPETIHHPTHCTCFDGTGCRVPNYSRSLDAVAEAENHLDTLAPATDNNAPRYRYSWALYNVVPHERQPFRATARQRAEALVSVIESLTPNGKV